METGIEDYVKISGIRNCNLIETNLKVVITVSNFVTGFHVNLYFNMESDKKSKYKIQHYDIFWCHTNVINNSNKNQHSEWFILFPKHTNYYI